MNPRELVDHIHSGPAKLMIDKPLCFRRRTPSNPCDFNEFLQALQSSETIRDVTCFSQVQLGITEDQWVLLVTTLGHIYKRHTVFGVLLPARFSRLSSFSGSYGCCKQRSFSLQTETES
jgi:hypothetical protein